MDPVFVIIVPWGLGIDQGQAMVTEFGGSNTTQVSKSPLSLRWYMNCMFRGLTTTPPVRKDAQRHDQVHGQ